MMTSIPWWAVFIGANFLLLLGVSIWVVYISSPVLTKKKVARLGGRESLSQHEYFTRFYPNSDLPEQVVSSVLNLVSEATHIPAGLIRPNDRIGVELARVRPWEPDETTRMLAGELYKEEERLGSEFDYRNIRTVDDYLRVLAAMRLGKPIPLINPAQYDKVRVAVITFLLFELIPFSGWALEQAVTKAVEHYDVPVLAQFLIPLLGVVVFSVLFRKWVRHVSRRFQLGKA